MTTTTQDPKTTAANWAAAWNTPGETALAGLFTADGTYTDLAIGQTFNGVDEIASYKARSDAMIADLHIEVLNAFGADGQIAIESVYSGHFRGAPQAFAVRGTTTLRMVDALIETNTDNYSLSTVLAQSGLPADWSPTAD